MTDIVFDLDGTLADCSHRLHWIQNKPKNWKAFYAGIEHDKPIPETIMILRNLAAVEDDHDLAHQIIFCTGRSESYRQATRRWLALNVGDWTIDCHLYMRADNDFRPDYVVKEELLSKMKEDRYSPRIAFEDRDQVVDMWRRNGLICYQVAKGAY